MEDLVGIDQPVVESEAIIVGAGPSGLAVAAALQKRRIPYLILEKGQRNGQSWHNHYDRLHLHTVKRFSSLPYMPFPRNFPRYPSRLQVMAYLDSYADEIGIEPLFEKTVEKACFRNDRWQVTAGGQVFTSRILIVATGYNREPNIPKFKDMDLYRGQVIHSSAYKNGRPYRGYNVLVVGCGNSGAEIALDLFENGARPAMVVRSPIHVIPRDVLGIPSQLTTLVLNRLPLKLADWLATWFLKLAVGDLSNYGIERPKMGPNRMVIEEGRVPLLDVGTVKWIKTGRIEVVPGINCFTESGVVFTNNHARNYNAVVLATGYGAGLDRFLENAGHYTDPRGYPRWHGRTTSTPGLFFIGFRNPPTGMLREIAIEAKRIAKAVKQTLR